MDNKMSNDVCGSALICYFPLAGYFDEVYTSLLNANPNLYVYKKEDIPDHYHYRHNDRIMPILLEAREGWTIVQNKTLKFMCKCLHYMNKSSTISH